jgi:N-acetylmuramoyl-L-alanine amidase
MKSSDKSKQFRAYNDYKNLYLQALMKDDKKLLLSSLKGIVGSGAKLHIDIAQYKEELAKTNVVSSYKAPTPKPIARAKSQNKIKVQASNELKSVTWENGRLILNFDKTLKTNHINYFTSYDSKKKKYQYVFDVKASMIRASQSLKKENIDAIKLSQYSPDSLRLAIEDSQKVNISFKKESSSLIINMKSSQKATRKEVRRNPPKRLDRNKIIVIDAGHGGKDPGALGYKKYREKIVVLQIAKDLKKTLNARGYKVYMTRSSDKFVKLSNRTKLANRKNADIFISIHANAVAKAHVNDSHGIECYFLSQSRSGRAKRVAEKENSADLSDMNFYGKESFLNTLNSHNIIAANKLAIDLQRGMLGTLNKSYKDVYDGGVREGPFWVLVGAQMPSVLVEVGFISHPAEAKRLVNSKYQERVALGLANGVERYFLNN